MLLAGEERTFAFALIGPYANWMDQTNGYRLIPEIGGPVAINEAYRWNVPLVTYGFDASFLAYFGSNGVAAVSKAMDILNGLPAASSIVLTNYPLNSKSANVAASAQDLFDLKSAVLSLMLGHLGLAPPKENIFDMRKWDPSFGSYSQEYEWVDWAIPDFIFERNYDPETLETSHYVNEVLFTGVLNAYGSPPALAEVLESPVSPIDQQFSAVADGIYVSSYLSPPPWNWSGLIFTGLTRDDAGGLRYLIASNRFSLEMLLPDVHGAGTNQNAYVNLALRAGVEKLTFTLQQPDPLTSHVSPVTNIFTDTYITNGTVSHQQLERIVVQPDFLFCVGDTGGEQPLPPEHVRTGASNWWNSATVTGSTNQGPGVIRPQIRITLNKMGSLARTSDRFIESPGTQSFRWGSFDQSSVPIVFPQPTAQTNSDLLVRFWLHSTNIVPDAHFTWKVATSFGAAATLQTSTNLLDWNSLISVTNYGGAVDWDHWRLDPQRFFRVVPQ